MAKEEKTKKFKQFKLKEQEREKFITEIEARALISTSLTNFSEVARVKKGDWRSGNFVTGSSGWQIKSTGDVEFNTGTFRGKLEIGSGNDIIIADPDDATFRLGIGSSDISTAPFRVDKDGNVTMTSVNIVNEFTTALDIDSGKTVMVLDDGTVAETFADTTGNGTPTAQFIGFATETITAGNTIEIKMSDKVTGLSGLTIASVYFLADTSVAVTETITQSSTDSSDTLAVNRTQTFKPTKTIIPSVKVLISSTATRNFTLRIKSGATTLVSKLVQVDTSGTPTLTTFTFSNPAFVTPGTSYTLQMDGTGFADAFVHYESTDVYADGVYSSGGDLTFRVNETEGDGEIGTSAGSVSKKVGLALSVTTLLLLNS